jgi:hypothetical protein
MLSKTVIYSTLFFAVTLIVISYVFSNSLIMIYENLRYTEIATAATSSAVTVNASVAATISCATNITNTSFGTITDSAVVTSTPNASTTISCPNSSAGCTLYVKDQGNGSTPGLYNSGASYVLVSTSTLLSAGTEGYGIQATTTSAGSGATLSISTTYNKTGNNVGGLFTSNTTLASTTATSSNREVVVTHKAAISNVTPAGNYTDTITYECTAN